MEGTPAEIISVIQARELAHAKLTLAKLKIEAERTRVTEVAVQMGVPSSQATWAPHRKGLWWHTFPQLTKRPAPRWLLCGRRRSARPFRLGIVQ
jgi:hypothetical protein